jgi:hypothetical protein
MKIKLSKTQWEEIGNKAGWMKTAGKPLTECKAQVIAPYKPKKSINIDPSITESDLAEGVEEIADNFRSIRQEREEAEEKARAAEYDANKGNKYYVTEYRVTTTPIDDVLRNSRDEDRESYTYTVENQTEVTGLKEAHDLADKKDEEHLDDENYIVYVEEEGDQGMMAKSDPTPEANPVAPAINDSI